MLVFINIFPEEGSLVLSDKKDQEIIVDSPPPRESMDQSSDSTPTLPYSHGQVVLPTSASSPSISSTTSSPVSAPQNVIIEHFPLVSSSSSSIYHSLLQPSSISLPDPPPYPNTVLLTPLGSTLYGSSFSSIYPQTTPLFGSNPLVDSSFSFSQQTFPSQSFLNLWSFPHTIYNPQPVYATVSNTNHFLGSNVSSSFLTLPINTSTTFPITSPTFTTISNTPKSSPCGPSRRRLTRIGKEHGVEATPATPPEKLILKLLTLMLLLSAILPFLPQALLGLAT